MNNETSQPSFSFAYEHGGKTVHVSFETETWTDALEEFTSFIGAAFGYSIKDKVGLKENPFGYTSDVWTGPVFNEEML